MGTYKNSYTEKEDHALWELHEIRHKLHKRRKNKSIDEINNEGRRRYADWQKERKARKVKEKTA